MYIHNIDPVILQICGPLAVRWYGLSYVLGAAGCYFYCSWLLRKVPSPHINRYHLGNLLSLGLIYAIIGGRVGHVLLYQDWQEWWRDPLSILRVWEGGMAFHGGAIGSIIAIWHYARTHKIPHWLHLADYVAMGAPLGIAAGRLANFINGEMHGRVITNSLLYPWSVKWSVIYPWIDMQPRHPSQLYEMTFEGLVLFAVLYWLGYCKRGLQRLGYTSGIFLVGYSLARSGCEFFREPERFADYLPEWITLGQLITLPILVIGIILIVKK